MTDRSGRMTDSSGRTGVKRPVQAHHATSPVGARPVRTSARVTRATPTPAPPPSAAGRSRTAAGPLRALRRPGRPAASAVVRNACTGPTPTRRPPTQDGHAPEAPGRDGRAALPATDPARCPTPDARSPASDARHPTSADRHPKESALPWPLSCTAWADGPSSGAGW
ncbi:hypothetical protein KPATCC21470_7785 [Kitasatospora purpeofusca]